MRVVIYDGGRHVARSVRGRRGPADLLGPGECEQSQHRARAKWKRYRRRSDRQLSGAMATVFGGNPTG